MKTLTKAELVYLRNLYEADLESESENNYTQTLDKIQSIIDEAFVVDFFDDILFSYRTKKQMPTYKSKKNRRYVVELTKAQFDALFSCAVCGQDVFNDDYSNNKVVVRKCDEAISEMNIARLNGMKSV
jgi:hypothetical protein